MNYAAIMHESKSNLSYAVDDKTIHLRIKVAKGDADAITVRAVDPFNWFPCEKNPDKYEFDYKSIVDVSMKKEQETEMNDIWFAEISDFVWSRIRYGFVICNKNEKIFYGNHKIVNLYMNPDGINDIWNYFNFPYINEEDIYKAPGWVQNTIWYQIFPYSFSYNGEVCTREHPGNLEGVIRKLDYLKDLGINGIYLTPIFHAESNHKYDTIDYFHVDPNLGTNHLLKELVSLAHKKGIRVMLDAVFNHCGGKHPFWKDVLEKGDKSQYIDYFYIVDKCKKPDEYIIYDKRTYCNYRTFGFVKDMPKWNLNNPKVREYLLEVAAYWIKEYDIDGWRLDVANEISHDFWRDFRKCVKSIKPDLYILGENWEKSMPWLSGDQFDSVMNYEFMNPVWAFLGECNIGKERHDSYNATQFMYAINELLAYYPKPVQKVLFNLLDSHDTSRIYSICGENLPQTMLAYVIQMTFAGTPCIYYGGENAAAGNEYTNRVYMTWDNSETRVAMSEHLKRLIDIRKHQDACTATQIHWLMADDKTRTILYKKTINNKSLYVLVHNSKAEHCIELPEELKNRTLEDVYNKQRIWLGKTIKLKPYDFLLLSFS